MHINTDAGTWVLHCCDLRFTFRRAKNDYGKRICCGVWVPSTHFHVLLGFFYVLRVSSHLLQTCYSSRGNDYTKLQMCVCDGLVSWPGSISASSSVFQDSIKIQHEPDQDKAVGSRVKVQHPSRYSFVKKPKNNAINLNRD